MSHGIREDAVAAAARLALVALLAEHYADFEDFLVDFMEYLGFDTSEVQRDIGRFMAEDDTTSIMVQAQRSQAKTTIAAARAIHGLIRMPEGRVLVVSAGGTQANEISTLITRVIMTWDILECIRPDKSAGDKTSYEAFDLHHSIKGVEKSPSVACVGIGANLQGKRADLLLADDVESSKNSLTAHMRAQLLDLTRDFSSICTNGKIIWLGTPQTSESIYNTLPGRGVTVRIWPGRYPTPTQVANYGSHLAPMLASKMAADPSLQTGGGMRGDQGQPIDPSFLGELLLQKKELDQGEAYFQLQHMLNTRLLDALRYQLKLEKVQVLALNRSMRVPVSIAPSFTPMGLQQFNHGTHVYRLSVPTVSPDSIVVPAVFMYVDPAGGGANRDETAYAIGAEANGNIYVFDSGGIPGGYDTEQMNALVTKAQEWGVNVMVIEQNMGYGAFKAVLTPVLKAAMPACGLEDDLVHGQKEARICATLAPIIGRGSLVLNRDVIEADWRSAQRYGSHAVNYTLLHQISKITLDRGSLAHDDRVDALEGLCRRLQPNLAKDQAKAQEAAERKAYEDMVRDPLGRNAYGRPPVRSSAMVGRFRR